MDRSIAVSPPIAENFTSEPEETQEIWAFVKGFGGLYKISSKGRLLSFCNNRHGKSSHGKFLRGGRHVRGYVVFSLHNKKNKKYLHTTAHRLVAEAFLPKIKGKMCVNHKDNNPLNNCVENLEWCTQAENVSHASGMGLTPKGEAHFISKLTEKQVIEIIESEESHYTICERYGISRQAVWDIRNKKTWKHLWKKCLIKPSQYVKTPGGPKKGDK